MGNIYEDSKHAKPITMKTALQQLKEEMSKYSWGHYDPISLIDKHLPTEREQINKAYDVGFWDPTYNDYFKTTYSNEGI